MTVLKIARMGQSVLHRCADEIPDPTAPEIRRLVADMMDTLEDADGAGLAAPQVFVPLRLVLFHVPAHRASGADDDTPEALTVLINPVLEPLGDEKEIGWEGCLSVPGMMGAVARHTHLRYRGLTLEGETIERTVSGFHARVVQHECDHLDGILYPMRVTDMSMFGFAEEMRERFSAPADAAVD
ncbi:MAG: peptide deformylase [Rhodospirillales bacterium]|nr:peptide deformylase [Rhodospirillales bacterium]